MKRRDLIKLLRDAGYQETRNDGGHAIYEKRGSRPVQIPNHREINLEAGRAEIGIPGKKWRSAYGICLSGYFPR